MEGAPAHASLIGATIGNYRVVAKLGEGGMGAVYLAEHPLIGKKVALKVLHEEYASNQEVVTRFFNEAKAVNDIGHPNIVDIIDYGVVHTPTGPGFVYFIMEFLTGESLASLLQREAPLDPQRAMNIAAQVADALSASHAKGIIHRDLKPDNIFVSQRGREKDFVKVLDFGIAKLTGDGAGSSRTRTGIVMGTPAYMSPEQCEGRGNIDHRTDVYAMGILLYEMITGRVPFVGEGYGEVLIQHLTKIPARPTTLRGVIPPAVEAIVMKALEKRREDRWSNMDEFITAMRDPEGYVAALGGPAALLGAAAAAPHAFGAGSTLIAPGVQAPGHPSSQPGLMSHAGHPMSQPGLMAHPGHPSSHPGVVPSSQPGLAPVPGRPTTLTSSAGQVVGGGRSSRKLLAIGGAAVATAAIVIGVVAAMTGGGTAEEAAQAEAAEQAAEATRATSIPEPPPPAPQPVVLPPPPKPPPPPPKIFLNLTTTPPGADVYVGEEITSRGQTPLKIELPKGMGQTVVTFKLEGYKPRTKIVKMSRDAVLEVSLSRERVATPSRSGDDRPNAERPRKRRPVDDDDVLAPSF